VKYAFWCAAAVIVYTYVFFPTLVWMRSRIASRTWKRDGIQPSVSIIVAVHNGLSLIQEQIPRLLGTDYPPDLTEIIIVSDGSTDGTAEYITSLEHERVHAFVLEQHSGKAIALNLGMQHARNQIIVFVDARPTLDRGAIRELVSNFADPGVGCAAGELTIEHHSSNNTASAVGGLYWRYEQWIRICEARVDSPLGVYGGFYAIRRSCAVPFPAGTILDDMFEPLAIVRQGYRSVIDTRARVSDHWPQTAQGEFQRKVRTLAGNFQLLQLAPWLLGSRNRLWFALVSHKLLRLAVPYALIVLLISSFVLSGSLFFAIISGLQVGFYVLALLGISNRLVVLRRTSSAASAFCLLNAAAVVGLYRFLFAAGPLWKIWTVPMLSQPTVRAREYKREITHAG
jgi:cellulose synthase/poly-beta-1,6-N-acetylglucosamine synthase-like glycosyltransferase